MAKGEKKNLIRKSQFGHGPRLYQKAVFTGFRRNKVWVNNEQPLLKIEGLNSRAEAQYYLGKRVVYIYKTKSGFKTIWGRIASPHGNNGIVKAKFAHNLPPRAIGATLRVMLYPHRNIA